MLCCSFCFVNPKHPLPRRCLSGVEGTAGAPLASAPLSYRRLRSFGFGYAQPSSATLSRLQPRSFGFGSAQPTEPRESVYNREPNSTNASSIRRKPSQLRPVNPKNPRPRRCLSGVEGTAGSFCVLNLVHETD
jgi:hypothetical protein